MQVLTGKIYFLFAIFSLAVKCPWSWEHTSHVAPRFHTPSKVWRQCSSFTKEFIARNHDLAPNSLTRRNIFSAFLLATSFTCPLVLAPTYATAAEWTDRNRLAAEAWRTVDDIYVDRSFNNQDWFGLRQKVVKRTYQSDEQVYQALQDMLSQLGDKYTRYLTPAQYGALLSSTRGELVGIGVELGLEGDQVTVLRVEPDSPAQRAGLKKSDRVVYVDSQSAASLSPEEVANLMRGREGTKVGVRVNRNVEGEGGEKSLDFVITRQPILLQGVDSKVYDVVDGAGESKKVMYISVRSFAENTQREVQRVLEASHREGQQLDFIVMDLRNNGGGLLQGAIDTSALFLPPGKIVVFVVNKDNLVEAKQVLPISLVSTDPQLPDLRTPIAILINENTASAAEVFAASMKENTRGVLLGTQSFGKGIIQSLQELRQGGVTVTIARYETPLHHNINKVGIEPDVKLVCEAQTSVEACLTAVVAQLPQHK